MSRQEYIEKYFLNIKLDIEYLDLYYVRTSILNGLDSVLKDFTGTLLDVGCGIMPYNEYILSHNKSVSKYIGLDFESPIDPEFDLGRPDIFWDGENIPMENNSVDTVIATEFFEHCPEPERVMIELQRVLKPGGILFLTVPFLWNLHLVPYDEYRYTPYSLQRHLKRAGFVNIQLKSLGGWDASLAQMLSLWQRQRRMRPSYRRFMGHLLKPIIKRLIKYDKRTRDIGAFSNGSMITGIFGIAYKNE